MPTIRELPENIKEIAIERMLTQHPGRITEMEKWLDNDPSFSFNFDKTPERVIIWSKVNSGIYREFYEFHSELGTPIINNTYPLF